MVIHIIIICCAIRKPCGGFFCLAGQPRAGL